MQMSVWLLRSDRSQSEPAGGGRGCSRDTARVSSSHGVRAFAATPAVSSAPYVRVAAAASRAPNVRVADSRPRRCRDTRSDCLKRLR